MKQQLRNKKNLFLYMVVLLLSVSGKIIGQVPPADRYTSNSVLASGNWFKIKISSSGIYKLSYSDLINMGISNPKNVQIYGYGGWALDEDFTNPYIDDLPQIAIWMSKPRTEFTTGDYILFYAKGDIKWTYNKTRKEFIHSQNPYSSDSYYFVTESEAGPILMDEISATGTAGTSVTTFPDYYLHEKDLINVEKTGREFFGENFLSTPSQNFNLKLPGITSNPAVLRYNFISKLQGNYIDAYLDIKHNNNTVKRHKVPFSSSSKVDGVNDTVTIRNLSENSTLNLTYIRGNSNDKNAYLNYFKIEYTRQLKPYGGVTLFRSTEQGLVKFIISEASDKILIFDVTKTETPKKINGNLSGPQLTFQGTELSEYAMVNTSANDIPTPSVVGRVENQNLHSLEPKEMVIIVRPFLKRYAEQLAEIHKKDSGLESLIVTPEDIYNEFSSGKPDVTAYRRFLKMFYDKNSTTAPKYLLLFGDGTYDNRFIENPWTESQKRAMLLTYQTQESLTESNSFVAEDYIGFLDDNEGGSDISLSSGKLDIAIGRLPVRSEAEARNAVDKIKGYIENKDYGIWKNNIAFYADDAITSDRSNETMHCEQADGIAETIKNKYPEYIIHKLYQDNYDRVITSNGARYPEANKALIDRLNSGLLLLNYIGHGSTRDWAHEYVFTLKDVKDLNNRQLPLWITATCDYSRFDAYETSAGEEAFLNPKGGAIALFSTTRTVYASYNKILNESIMNHLFEKKDNKPMRLGDILRNAKTDLGNQQNKVKFILLGDPALRLSYPEESYRVEIREVNEIDAADNNIQIKALDSNKIKGVIVDINGNIATDFSGKLESVIFDSELDLKTRGHKLPEEKSNTAVPYKDFINTIYSGSTTITNGEFTINFVTPLDILYTNGEGKMSFYAYDNAGRDAQGSFTNYKVGGKVSGLEEKNPPVIRQLYLNKADFVSGDKVNMTPMFFAEVYDDTGINQSSAIGHNISLTVDGLKSYNLSSNYVSKSLSNGETGTLGTINFSIPNLTEGKHTLQFRVWDVFNNSTTHTIDFECIADYKPTIFKFEIQGNPASTSTNFVFHSDLTGSNVMVKYEVYSLTGALQWSHEETGTVDYMSEYSYNWDLTASNGSRLQPGMYICRMNVSVNGKVKSSKSEKLIILGQ